MLFKAKISGQDLKSFLAESMKISKSKAKEVIDSKQVFVNNKRVWMAVHKLKSGDKVDVNAPEKSGAQKKQVVLYEDDNVIAVNKPPDVVSDEAKNSLESILRKQTQNPGLCAIHRLDKETSGVMLFAKSRRVFEAFKAMWQEKEVKKVYYAVCIGAADFVEKTVSAAVDGKTALTRFFVICKGNGLSMLKAIMETGRKHQIRVHLKSLGFPVLGDKTYGPNVIAGKWQKSVKRQMLHSYEIEYKDPYTGNRIKVTALFPQDFLEAAARAGFKETRNPELGSRK